MTKKTLEAHEFALKDVFCDEYAFEIPGYQRPYSWDIQQAETLVDDLLQFLEEQPDNIKDADPYFLGSIVLIKPHGTLSQVVDGQQRLTTLTILFSVLRTLVPEDFRMGLEQAIFQKGSKVLMTQDKPRLKTRSIDQLFFLKHIQESGNLDKLLNSNETLNDSQSNMRANAKVIFDKLNVLEGRERGRLCQFLMLGCFVVVVTTPDVDSAYRIFSIMNDRGLDLSPTDILKALITGAISEANNQLITYTNKWEELEENIGRDNFNSLFAHIRMIEMRAKSRSNMVADFKKHIKPEINSISFIDNKLVPYTQIYGEILDQGFKSNAFEAEINKSLYWLRRIDNNDWVPPAIYYMAKHRNSPECLARFLKLLERCASVQMINRISINYRITRYTNILNAIDKDAEFDEDSKIFLEEGEKREAIRQINGPIYNLRNIRVMVLLRLDSELSDSMAHYNHPRITVEHVMPQNPELGSQWLEWCPDEEVYAELVHCLGNLALLSRNKNSSAKNYEFDKKKEAYFHPVSGHTAFVLTNQVLSENTWTPDLIRERQQQLVAKLINVWGLEAV